MKKLLRALLFVMPICLFLSYHPVMKLGESESMYFELSVAEIWLVVFDIVGVVELWREKKLLAGFRDKWWVWVLLPVWVSLSVVWSLNTTRGVLTAGLMWAVVVAIYIMVSLRGVWDSEFRGRWWRWFFGSSLLVCGWCVVQCILDLAGVPQSCTLLCDGCTYRMFGFPHPNGFAIEPQFMGNLLLAPLLTAGYLGLKNKKYLIIFGVIVFTLFLTFSRGAIYAGVVGLLFMSGFVVARCRKKERGVMWKKVGIVWSFVMGAFVVSLVAQGVMAEVSPTNDTFSDGVAKVVNHLTLGVIDLRSSSEGGSSEEVVEKPVEKSEGTGGVEKQEAVFDGYVAESTDTRVRLTGAAVKVWAGDFRTALVGVGLGGAGQALYNNGLSPAPREIVQNEYASLLLETGLVGISLVILTVVLVVRFVLKQKEGAGLILSLLVAYGVSLMFFSGLPNALHIYLMPVVLVMVARSNKMPETIKKIIR